MPKANKHAEVKPSKFKTTLCSFYMAEKECPFGAKCAFAHGEEELLHEQDNVALLKQTGLQRLEPLFETEQQKDNKIKTNIISSTSDASSATSENVQPSAVAVAVAATPVTVIQPQPQPQQIFPTSPVHQFHHSSTNSYNHNTVNFPHSPNTNTNNSSFAFGASRSNASFSQNMAAPKRRPVMVSLPKHNTTSEQIHSPYASAYQADSHVTQFSYNNNNQQHEQQQQQYYQQQPQQQYYNNNNVATTPVRRVHQPYGQQPYVQQQQQYIDTNNNNHNHYQNNSQVVAPGNKCQLEMSSTCRKEQPLVYRHNPYRFS